MSGTSTYAADGSTDTFTNFESYVLTQQADTIEGSAGDDVVAALGGDDVFTASQGADTLRGGVGSDTVDYSTVAGISGVDVALNGDVEVVAQVSDGSDDTLSGIENIIATAGDDTLSGDDQDNSFEALGGDDTLNGGGGDDQLVGGEGDDTFIASSGQNTYQGGTGIDTLDYSTLVGVTSVQATLTEVCQHCYCSRWRYQ